MRIRELAAFHVRIPLRKRIKHASYSRTFTDSLLVRCRLDDESVGWGEGLPRPYVTGETIESAWEQLRASNLASQLGGRCDDYRQALDLLAELRFAPLGDDPRGCFGNSVRCALELSVLDAVGRSTGQPLSAVTRLVPETAGIRGDFPTVRYSAAFTAMSPAKQVLRALLVRGFGFKQGKVKVGVEGVDDAALLRRLRAVLGKRFDLRLDANESWTCDTFAARLEPLLPFDVSSVEQPVPHAEVGGLAALRGRFPVSLMLDESLCSLRDARQAIEQGTCDLFNIRLSKCGGFVASLRIAAAAHQAGLGYQLGCQVGETGILSAAGRHFATSVAGIRFLEGSYDRFLVRERLTAEDLTFGYGGLAPALTGGGLGVTVDPAAVARVTREQQNWTFG